MQQQNETVVARTTIDFIYPASSDGQLDESAWTKGGTLTITHSQLLLSSGSKKVAMALRGMEDIDYITSGNRSVLLLTRYENGQFQSCALGAAPKAIESLRRYFIQFIADAFKTSVYFISPISRGGVVLTTGGWEQGLLLATQRSIWFMSRDKQIRVGLGSIVQIRREARRMGGKDRNVLTVDHLDKGEALSSIVLCPDNTMDMLENYLGDLVKKSHSLGKDQKLTELEGQIATLIYSGVDSSTIQSMLSLDAVALDQFYDKLLAIGMARVARVRRELELSPKGVKYVADLANIATAEKK